MDSEIQPSETSKKKRTGLAVAALVAALLVGFGVGVIVPIGNGGDEGTSATDDRESSVAEEETEEPIYSPTVDDFEVELRVKEEECFGSAGCNLTLAVEPSYVGTNANYGSDPWDVTYVIRGGTDGPVTQTMTMEGDNINFTPEVAVSTNQRGQKMTTKITRVDPGY